MQRPRLVIFDCDGVLVDSEPITSRVLGEMLNEVGIGVTPEEVMEEFTGRSMEYCREKVARVCDPDRVARFVEEYRYRILVALKSQTVAIPGIEAVLNTLDEAGIPYCVASNGAHEKMRTTLASAGLLPRFEGKLFSATEVVKGKPAPDVYLHAARQSGITPVQCCVIEDSPTGVAAGCAAGMTVYGYSAVMSGSRLIEAGASHAFPSMQALPGLILQALI